MIMIMIMSLIRCCSYPAEEDGQDHFSRFHMRRRSKLPMPKVESDVSVWSLLCKNIGKDLSKVSMPVSMNEPLNALQVLPYKCLLHCILLFLLYLLYVFLDVNS